MSALPSPLKSPTFTSVQVTLGFQVAHRTLVKELPVDWASHHRPTMSALPSPLKSPTLTSTQVTAGLADQAPKCKLVKEVPLERATHQSPDSFTRPTRSARPSPLKSPLCTSTHVTALLQLPHTEVLKELPSEVPTK